MMYDQHVKDAAIAVQQYYESIGQKMTLEDAAINFRIAAEMWSRDKDLFEIDYEEEDY